MSERSYIRDEDGNVTHVRETNDDGRRSFVYEYNDSVLPWSSEKGPLTKIQEHDEDGTSTSYHPPEGVEHLPFVPLRRK